MYLIYYLVWKERFAFPRPYSHSHKSISKVKRKEQTKLSGFVTLFFFLYSQYLSVVHILSVVHVQGQVFGTFI